MQYINAISLLFSVTTTTKELEIELAVGIDCMEPFFKATYNLRMDSWLRRFKNI